MARSVSEAVDKAEELAAEIEDAVDKAEELTDELGQAVSDAEEVAAEATGHVNRLSNLVQSSYNTLKNLPRPTQVILAIGSVAGAAWYFGLV